MISCQMAKEFKKYIFKISHHSMTKTLYALRFREINTYLLLSLGISLKITSVLS